MPDATRPHQPELPLSRDDREAHETYLRSPPAKAGERRPEGYFEGLMIELKLKGYPAKQPSTGRAEGC